MLASTPIREVVLRFLAEPAHVNFGGKVHGGQVMKWIDQAAYACASSWSGRYCVTAYVGGIHFEQPIRIGEIVDVAAMVILTGRTSVHVAVEVSARLPTSGERRETTHCVLVFVAVDVDGKPTPVPAWVAQSDADKTLERYALRLKELERAASDERKKLSAHIAVKN